MDQQCGHYRSNVHSSSPAAQTLPSRLKIEAGFRERQSSEGGLEEGRCVERLCSRDACFQPSLASICGVPPVLNHCQYFSTMYIPPANSPSRFLSTQQGNTSLQHQPQKQYRADIVVAEHRRSGSNAPQVDHPFNTRS